jgi:hypothetical protein
MSLYTSDALQTGKRLMILLQQNKRNFFFCCRGAQSPGKDFNITHIMYRLGRLLRN